MLDDTDLNEDMDRRRVIAYGPVSKNGLLVGLLGSDLMASQRYFMSGICFRSIPLPNKDYAVSFSDVSAS